MCHRAVLAGQEEMELSVRVWPCRRGRGHALSLSSLAWLLPTVPVVWNVLASPANHLALGQSPEVTGGSPGRVTTPAGGCSQCPR